MSSDKREESKTVCSQTHFVVNINSSTLSKSVWLSHFHAHSPRERNHLEKWSSWALHGRASLQGLGPVEKKEPVRRAVARKRMTTRETPLDKGNSSSAGSVLVGMITLGTKEKLYTLLAECLHVSSLWNPEM